MARRLVLTELATVITESVHSRALPANNILPPQLGGVINRLLISGHVPYLNNESRIWMPFRSVYDLRLSLLASGHSKANQLEFAIV